MSKKDYIAIADIIREENYGARGSGRNTVAKIASGIADYCAQDNPQFDRARFLQACGVQS